MRSVILVVTTAFVLAMGGLVYFWNSGRGHAIVAKPSNDLTNIPAPRATDNPMHISPGNRAAVKKYDQQTGELASEYLAEEYSPRKGGLVDVKNAIARFYLEHGQKVIELHGDTGVFRTDTPQSKSKAFTEIRGGTPNSGRMKDVTITIFDTVGDPQHRTLQPNMVITMPNAAFDGENGLVVTESYQDPQTGAMIPEDQVPVKMRSPESNPNGYDFDGKGLKLQWNERDHRLASLDIAHGEVLVIKNPHGMQESDTPRRRSTTTQPATQLVAVTKPTEVAQASGTETNAAEETTDNEQPEPATAPAGGRATTRYIVGRRGRRHVYQAPPPMVTKLTPNLQPPIYRAEFHDKVQIKQNGETMATADLMTVDFWMLNKDDTWAGQSESDSAARRAHPHAATDQASTEPRGAAAAVESAGAEPLSTPAPEKTQFPSTEPASKPATKPSDAPVFVYWTGPLHVIPHPEATVALHKEIVTLTGAPVVAQQKDSQLRSTKLVYNTDDGSMRATSPGGGDVLLTSVDPKQGKSVIKTVVLDYFSQTQPRTAVLSGTSSALLPTESNGEVLNASWTDRCTLHMAGTSDSQMELRDADLNGDVHVTHPQLDLKSQRLELFFAPATKAAKKAAAALVSSDPASQPAAQTNLKQMVASDNVHCIMFDSQHKQQTIDTSRLTVLTEPGPDGKLVPHTVNADGDVHAVDDEQDLTSGHLAVTLAPSTKPATTRKVVASVGNPSTQPGSSTANAQAVDLVSLIAEEHVHVIGKKDGSNAYSDTMLVDNVKGKKTVKLIGQPFAEIIQKTNHIFGQIIDLASDDQQMAIDGPGRMIGVQQDGPTTRPIDVTWSQGMRGDGRTNIVNAYGNVLAKTVDAEGRSSAVQSEQAQLLLVDVPTTKPASRPATQVADAAPPSKSPATGPATNPADDPMSKKTVRQAIFRDNAHVSSTLLDAQGLILQRMNLYSSVVQYDVLPLPAGAVPGATMKRITVPAPGKMLVEDYRPAPPHQDNQNDPTGGLGARGATGFQWDKSLVYDDSTHRAVMDGDVVINHRDDLNKDNSMHMTGDKVIADLESSPVAAPNGDGKAATPAGATPAGANAKLTTKPSNPQLRHIDVKGHVHVDMKGGELVANHIEYDPLTRIMVAYGTPVTDAVFTRAQATLGGTQPIRAQVLKWDAGQDLPTIIEGAAEMRR